MTISRDRLVERGENVGLSVTNVVELFRDGVNELMNLLVSGANEFYKNTDPNREVKD